MYHFVISPLIAYIKAFRYPERRDSAITLILFVLLYGFLMDTDSVGADLYRYLRMLKTADSPMKAILDYLNRDSTDIYRSLSISIISLFTHNGHILMAWFGLVLGFFMSKSLKFFRCEDTVSFIFIFIIIGLSIHGLAGVRHITAFWLFFYGLNIYIVDNKSSGLLIMLSSTLIHFSFLMMVAMLIPFYFLKNRTRLCIIIFLVSFIFSIPSISQIISSLASNLGSAFESRASTYSLQNTIYVESLQKMHEKAYWFIQYKTQILLLGLLCFGLVLYLKRKTITLCEKEIYLINFFLLMFAFRNIVVDIPDVGVRVTGFCTNIALYAVYMIYMSQNIHSAIRIATYIVLLSDFLNIAYYFRSMIEYVNIWEMLVTPLISVSYNILQNA